MGQHIVHEQYFQLVNESYFSFLFSGFLTAVLQNHARKLSVSVDALSFNFSVLPSFNDTDESLRDTKSKRNVLESAFVVSLLYKCL